jgi:hypothetical protein
MSAPGLVYQPPTERGSARLPVNPVKFLLDLTDFVKW